MVDGRGPKLRETSYRGNEARWLTSGTSWLHDVRDGRTRARSPDWLRCCPALPRGRYRPRSRSCRAATLPREPMAVIVRYLFRLWRPVGFLPYLYLLFHRIIRSWSKTPSPATGKGDDGPLRRSFHRRGPSHLHMHHPLTCVDWAVFDERRSGRPVRRVACVVFILAQAVSPAGLPNPPPAPGTAPPASSGCPAGGSPRSPARWPPGASPRSP